MAESLKPVSLAEFQAYLFEKRDQGLRFSPARETISETEHLWAYMHPATNEVCALVEVPRSSEGFDLDEQKVFYILH